MNEIPETDLNHIKGLARKHAAKSFSFISADDLFQEGCIVYLEGKKRYDASKNTYYMGFIYQRVVGAMLDYIAAQSINGSATVRNIPNKPLYKQVSIDALYYDIIEEDDKIFDEITEEADRELVYKKFEEYIASLTELEKRILIGYFVDRKSMVTLSSELSTNRLKIRSILNACVMYLKRRFSQSLQEKVNWRVVSAKES